MKILQREPMVFISDLNLVIDIKDKNTILNYVNADEWTLIIFDPYISDILLISIKPHKNRNNGIHVIGNKKILRSFFSLLKGEKDKKKPAKISRIFPCYVLSKKYTKRFITSFFIYPTNQNIEVNMIPNFIIKIISRQSSISKIYVIFLHEKKNEGVYLVPVLNKKTDCINLVKYLLASSLNLDKLELSFTDPNYLLDKIIKILNKPPIKHKNTNLTKKVISQLTKILLREGNITATQQGKIKPFTLPSYRRETYLNIKGKTERMSYQDIPFLKEATKYASHPVHEANSKHTTTVLTKDKRPTLTKISDILNKRKQVTIPTFLLELLDLKNQGTEPK